MANRHKGQVSREIDGTVYTFELTVNAFCDLEEATGKATLQIMQDMEKAAQTGDVQFRDIRRIFWAALIEHHPDITEREAGRVLTKVGDMEAQMAFLEDVFALAMPDSTGDASSGSEGNGTAAA
ncbi:GTA-gp10 family protein [Ponticoccus alexandrii]|uniref:Gene transfer agent family protein n=1 Tax=Ponticoccus alexandrii TaxID=1943633 RepID=A0ABX7F9A4_9RHOB|nr:GTA-gp10 family protein [Ponticoccus alexandrii]ETA53984.1 hypothetical protein P279_00360 [Rhodobacteraceae bacterium PD-2]QRF66382.1 gene transfer agent family protein [Ponticoccus alexandrii]